MFPIHKPDESVWFCFRIYCMELLMHFIPLADSGGLDPPHPHWDQMEVVPAELKGFHKIKLRR